ncbi:MAG: T9SS type A sorting domain-containing protein, partial [Bacteroidota bacterium]
DTIFSHVIAGNVPDFQRYLIPVSITETIGSNTYNITYYVLSDYLAVGHDTNYFLCPMTPVLAQRIASFCFCTMPTRKMVNEIYSAASVKLAPITQTPGPQMTTVPYFALHNDTVWSVRSAILGTHPLGELVGGDKKDVVISNLIYSSGDDRVVIYGWHQLSGVPIQPLYNGHILEYADYSHGIRLVQDEVYVNGDTMSITGLLQDPSLYQLFSDEGQIAVPWYPVPTVQINTPMSFAILNDGQDAIRVLISNPGTYTYIAHYGTDGLTFPSQQILDSGNPVITGLTSGQPVYIKLVATDGSNESLPSEVLGGVPSSNPSRILVVNAFDRSVAGNSFDFIRQHGGSISSCGYEFSSATNEAISEGLVNLSDYESIDYIFGKESSLTETFTSTEQSLISLYLQQGGYLFVSGSEIAWDLDHLGSATDSVFYHQFLKAAYVEDAPYNTASSWYTVEPVAGSIFDLSGQFNFDDGTNGTYNVDWPDVINGINGSENCLSYSGATGKYAGISYYGMFPGGSSEGKLVHLAFPFETVYPEAAGNNLMDNVLEFFFGGVFAGHNQDSDFRIFPNPFESTINIMSSEDFQPETRLEFINALGETVRLVEPVEGQKIQLTFGSEILPGIYFLRITEQGQTSVFKIIKE